MTDRHLVYLGLGSNLGEKRAHILHAIEKIQGLIGDVVRRSALFVSQPWGFQSSNDFVNVCICCETTMSPRELLEATQQIERELGRSQKSVDGVYHDRIIDIDILLYDDLQVDEPDLKIPHPLMRQRDFVMLPLLTIMP